MILVLKGFCIVSIFVFVESVLEEKSEVGILVIMVVITTPRVSIYAVCYDAIHTKDE